MKEILTLLQLRIEGETILGAIGGFDLIYDGERFGKGDGYRFQAALQRTGANYDIDLDVTVTPLGAISRLEHALGDFEGEQQRYRHRLDDAHRRLASYRSREGGTFAFAEELADKRRQVREVEKRSPVPLATAPTRRILPPESRLALASSMIGSIEDRADLPKPDRCFTKAP